MLNDHLKTATGFIFSWRKYLVAKTTDDTTRLTMLLFWQVYWAGPIIGGIVAALLYEKVFRARSAEEERELEDYQYRAANAKESEIIADRTTTI